jgi:hypothetical protein
MPIVKASNGVRPEIRALKVITLNKAVTPGEINKEVGTGDYAAKYVTFLRRLGFEFTSKKDGRSIVSYTLVKEPLNVADFRNAAPKEKTKAVVKTKAKTKKVVKAKTKKVSAEDQLKGQIRQEYDGVVSSSSIDGDFDSVEDVRSLV